MADASDRPEVFVVSASDEPPLAGVPQHSIVCVDHQGFSALLNAANWVERIRNAFQSPVVVVGSIRNLSQLEIGQLTNVISAAGAVFFDQNDDVDTDVAARRLKIQLDALYEGFETPGETGDANADSLEPTDSDDLEVYAADQFSLDEVLGELLLIRMKLLNTSPEKDD